MQLRPLKVIRKKRAIKSQPRIPFQTDLSEYTSNTITQRIDQIQINRRGASRNPVWIHTHPEPRNP